MAVELGERLLAIALAGLRAAERRYTKTMAALSAKEFLEDGGRSRRDFFVGKELRADLQSGFRAVDADDVGEQARSSMSRVLAARAFIAKIWRGDAAVTRRPG
jgi:hypothetical protein